MPALSRIVVSRRGGALKVRGLGAGCHTVRTWRNGPGAMQVVFIQEVLEPGLMRNPVARWWSLDAAGPEWGQVWFFRLTLAVLFVMNAMQPNGTI